MLESSRMRETWQLSSLYSENEAKSICPAGEERQDH